MIIDCVKDLQSSTQLPERLRGALQDNDANHKQRLHSKLLKKKDKDVYISESSQC